jgi:hypothetical protein
MPTLNDVLAGSLAQAVQVQQIIDAMKGTTNKGVPVSYTSLNDPNNYALTVRNLDPTNSRALSVLKSDGTSLITADATGVKLAGPLVLPSGVHLVAPVIDSGGLTITAGDMIASTGAARVRRVLFNYATSLSNANFSISGQWGTGASVTAGANATDQQGSFTIVAATGPSANGTVTMTFADGAFASAPHGLCFLTGGSGAGTNPAVNVSTTTTNVTFQMFFTPVNGQSYTFSYLLFGYS